MEKDEFLKRIKANIDKHGYHVTTVTGGACPRFSYTIGLKDKIGYELIFAGGENLSAELTNHVLDEVYNQLVTNPNLNDVRVNVASSGSFTVSEVDPSWSQLLMLGAFDFYQTSEIKACQVSPEPHNKTLDVPDLTIKFNAVVEPIWKWLTLDWPYPVPVDSIVITNIASLYGQKTTEATRWEEKEWEIFVGSGLDIDKESTCIVPLATLLGIDNSLEPVLNLHIGKGIWRDSIELTWHEWN